MLQSLYCNAHAPAESQGTLW